MDSLTHIALGACIGDAMLGKQLGKRAMFFGAVAQSIPDIDFTASLWSSTAEGLLAHRGFTHSILFVVLISFTLAFIAEKKHRPHNISFKKWIFFFGLQGMIHLFIDGMNVYGVGWFEPFSHERIAYNWIFVADPFYSIWPGIAFFVLLIISRYSPTRDWWAITFGVGVSSVYLLYCGINKWKIDHDAREIFYKQQIVFTDYFTTPTPLNNWLWYIVAAVDSGYQIGYRSVFDKEKVVQFQYVPKNDYLLTTLRSHEDLQKLIRFSKGYYTVQYWNDTLVFNDLRFGQMVGWEHPDARFVFYYYLQLPENNRFVIQRGRFEKWDGRVLQNLFDRIRSQP